ncbi:MAG TPA: DUF459 domain-containing protein [Thermoleophilia bacterium]|nr:DUF459 domain-containing protein [Thermoleophilia bacterium]
MDDDRSDDWFDITDRESDSAAGSPAGASGSSAGGAAAPPVTSSPSTASAPPPVRPRPRRAGGRDGFDFDGRRPLPAGKVLLAAAVGVALATLLTAASLERTARALPYGPQRTVAVALARPLAAVSRVTLFDRPARGLSALLGRTSPEEQAGQALSDLGAPSGGPSAVPTPTADRPLRIWVGGDSLAQNTGAQVVRYADETGVMKATLDYHISTGLSRPDFYDWPRRLGWVANAVQPDVAVAFFGANDAQSVAYDGQVLPNGSRPWLALYHQRVGAAMDTLLRGGATHVYWIGLPVMKDPAFSRTARVLNTVFAHEAAKRPGVTFVDTWRLFLDPSGHYAPYLRNADGELLLMRQADGVHLTLAGASRQGWSIVHRIARDYHVEDAQGQ